MCSECDPEDNEEEEDDEPELPCGCCHEECCSCDDEDEEEEHDVSDYKEDCTCSSCEAVRKQKEEAAKAAAEAAAKAKAAKPKKIKLEPGAVDYDAMLVAMTTPDKQYTVSKAKFLKSRKPASLNTVRLYRGVKVQATMLALKAYDSPAELVMATVNMAKLGRHWSDQEKSPKKFSGWTEKKMQCLCEECASKGMSACYDCNYYQKLCSSHGGKTRYWQLPPDAQQIQFAVILEAEVHIDSIVDRDTPEGRYYEQNYAVYSYDQEQEVTVKHGSVINIDKVRVKSPHMELEAPANLKAVV